MDRAPDTFADMLQRISRPATPFTDKLSQLAKDFRMTDEEWALERRRTEETDALWADWADDEEGEQA